MGLGWAVWKWTASTALGFQTDENSPHDGCTAEWRSKVPTNCKLQYASARKVRCHTVRFIGRVSMKSFQIAALLTMFKRSFVKITPGPARWRKISSSLQHGRSSELQFALFAHWNFARRTLEEEGAQKGSRPLVDIWLIAVIADWKALVIIGRFYTLLWSSYLRTSGHSCDSPNGSSRSMHAEHTISQTRRTD